MPSRRADGEVREHAHSPCPEAGPRPARLDYSSRCCAHAPAPPRPRSFFACFGARAARARTRCPCAPAHSAEQPAACTRSRRSMGVLSQPDGRRRRRSGRGAAGWSGADPLHFGTKSQPFAVAAKGSTISLWRAAGARASSATGPRAEPGLPRTRTDASPCAHTPLCTTAREALFARSVLAPLPPECTAATHVARPAVKPAAPTPARMHGA